MLRSFGLVDQFRTLAAFVCAATLASTPAIAQDGVPPIPENVTISVNSTEQQAMVEKEVGGCLVLNT